MSQSALAVRSRACRAARLLRIAALGLPLFVVAPSVAFAQDSGGPIVIPGPGEKNPAALAELANHMTSAAPAKTTASMPSSAALSAALGPSTPRSDDRFTQAANASGAIVIPGTGDVVAQATRVLPPAMPVAQVTRVAPTMPVAPVTPSAPAIRRVSFTPAAAEPPILPEPAGIVRANLAASSRDVMPVVVAPATAQPGVRAAPIAANPARAVLPVQVAALKPQPAALKQTAPVSQPVAATVNASPAGAPAMQDGETIRRAALAWLQQQAAGLPGKVEITVAPVFPRGLAACTTLSPFMPTGARLWGRTTVGVRCAGERPWTLYLQTKVSIHATYYLAARALAPGDVLTSADLVARDGDLTVLPMAIVTDPSQAVGAAALTRVAAGMPLRQDMLRSSASVSIGQTVRVVAQGQGFAISAEGSAMNNAGPGQQVRVKTASGQIISGIVKDGSTVEIQL
ncbi:flagellar basal body P-ring formation chaperone FlgA [Paraburkholderia flava]|uniref:flagellar basal body P-ring formation chaperone FlgA n=1 Tax=Paraburkholderia flava TaxID=2547393 RepID=UPI00105C831D|nr:flagellar basal body P-ring formation chaperone FlgA [Paraburkholderia flava]